MSRNSQLNQAIGKGDGGQSVSAADSIIGPDDPILVTGASGFIGSRVVQGLVARGFRNLRCFTRPSSDMAKLKEVARCCPSGARMEFIKGNLLSRGDCARAAKEVAVIYHLAAGRGEKAFPDAFMNSVVTTRNLLEESRQQQSLRRFVSISSFSVYSNLQKPRGRLLDESCPVESHPERRGDAYSFAKIKQDQIVAEYGKKFAVPHVIVRPGVVYGPGNEAIHGRVGIGTFGLFLHLGGRNAIPLTYVDNCAEAVVLAGLKPGVEGEAFNVVDDDLPSSRQFLRLYKKNVRRFRSLYLPHLISYALCGLWEKYSAWSEGQLPPVYNRLIWHVSWKKTRYTNEKLKRRLGWTPKISSAEGLNRYFESCRRKTQHA
jgi:nucleoside-diphosphate-sugar epimerase